MNWNDNNLNPVFPPTCCRPEYPQQLPNFTNLAQEDHAWLRIKALDDISKLINVNITDKKSKKELRIHLMNQLNLLCDLQITNNFLFRFINNINWDELFENYCKGEGVDHDGLPPLVTISCLPDRPISPLTL